MATPTRLSTPNEGQPKKLKWASDRYKIPDNEYAQLAALKKRLLLLGVHSRKSELLRAGLMLLAASGDVQLKQAVAKLEIIKTARPPQTVK